MSETMASSTDSRKDPYGGYDEAKGRRRYRPLRWRGEAAFAHWAYPELVRGFRAAAAAGRKPERGGRTVVDLMAEPAVRPCSEDGDTAAVFCRAGLWMARQGDVLFLDRPVWRDPLSPLRMVRRDAAVTRPYTTRPTSGHEGKVSYDVRLAEGDEVGSLEEGLYQTLKDAAELLARFEGAIMRVCACFLRLSDTFIGQSRRVSW